MPSADRAIEVPDADSLQAGIQELTRFRGHFSSWKAVHDAPQPIPWHGSSVPMALTGAGGPTSPIFRLGPGFCFLRWCSMPSAAGSSVRRWPSTFARNWCSPRTTWRSGIEARKGSCISRIMAPGRSRSRLALAARKRACAPRSERGGRRSRQRDVRELLRDVGMRDACALALCERG